MVSMVMCWRVVTFTMFRCEVVVAMLIDLTTALVVSMLMVKRRFIVVAMLRIYFCTVMLSGLVIWARVVSTMMVSRGTAVGCVVMAFVMMVIIMVSWAEIILMGIDRTVAMSVVMLIRRAVAVAMVIMMTGSVMVSPVMVVVVPIGR